MIILLLFNRDHHNKVLQLTKLVAMMILDTGSHYTIPLMRLRKFNN